MINVNQERAKDFPDIYEGDIIGKGYLCRMRPDGKEKQLLTDKVVEGMFCLHDNKIFFKSYEDKKLHVISEDGQKEFDYENKIDLRDYYEYYIDFCGNYGIIRSFNGGIIEGLSKENVIGISIIGALIEENLEMSFEQMKELYEI